MIRVNSVEKKNFRKNNKCYTLMSKLLLLHITILQYLRVYIYYNI